MSTPNDAEMKVPIRTVIPGCTTVLLANGDAILIQADIENVRKLLGQKDASGNPAYNFDIRHNFTVIPNGAHTTTDPDGRDGQQPC